MPPDGYPAFLQYLQSGRVSDLQCLAARDIEPGKRSCNVLLHEG